MSLEIEAKFAVDDPAAMRGALDRAGATFVRRVREVNVFFDRPDASLRAAGHGLRLRTETGDRQRHVVTFKGARLPGKFKTRPEHEFVASDAAAVMATFAALGLGPTLTFEKDRDTFNLDDCEVVLDYIEQLGHFIEVEGPAEASVDAVCMKLGLTGEPLQSGYAAMLGKDGGAHRSTELRRP